MAVGAAVLAARPSSSRHIRRTEPPPVLND